VIDWIQLFGGLLFLLLSGEILVKSAVKLAKIMRVSPMVIGLTVVAFGTSVPELVVSLSAAMNNHPDIAIGNVVGSNIANLAIVLGITSLIFPMRVLRSNLSLDWPFMLLVTVVMMVFSLDGILSRTEGSILFLMLVAYTFFSIRKSRQEFATQDNNLESRFQITDIFRWISLFVLSLLVLIVASHFFIEGAIEIARDFGISERIIGLTVIAFGTSTPELVTSIIAAYRKEQDMSIGNLIGSNIFNITGILGLSSMVEPLIINSQIMRVDMWWCLGIPILLLPFLITHLKVRRLEAIALLSAYFVYIYVII
jgi:cation:H+ antiporter